MTEIISLNEYRIQRDLDIIENLLADLDYALSESGLYNIWLSNIEFNVFKPHSHLQDNYIKGD